MDSSQDRALNAFRRLLADASTGGQAKVDALVALSQRTVLVPTWTAGGDDFRPLMSSEGQNALPLFSSKDELENAARRFGWLGPDGTVPHREIGSRGAFRHALANQLHFLVVDITAEWALEIERTEVEPLLAARNRSDSSGAFAGVGRISDMMMRRARSSGSMAAVQPDPIAPPRVSAELLAPAGQSASAGSSGRASSAPAAQESAPATASARISPDQVQILPLEGPPPEPLLDAASDLLREYPEVEWAAFMRAVPAGGDAAPTLGLRIDTGFRTRVDELCEKLTERTQEVESRVQILLLDDPALMRAARADALVFFPWRPRS